MQGNTHNTTSVGAGTTTTRKRRLDSLVRHLFMSKPLQYTITMTSNLMSNQGQQQYEEGSTHEQQQKNHHGTTSESIIGGGSEQFGEKINSDAHEELMMKDEKLHNNQNDSRTSLSIDHQQVVNDLETDKLTPNQALDLAQTLIDNLQFGQARQFIFAILPYIPSNNGEDNQNENSNPSRRAYRLIGLSYYNNNELKESLPWFRKAALDSNSVQDWFNLANAAAQIDNRESSLIRLANYAFTQIEELQKNSNFQLKPSFWIQLYYFTIALMNGGHYNEAFNQLNRLKLAYKRARFTDKVYLEEIGLPSFDSFISLSLNLFRRVDRQNQGFEFLKQMEQGVDDAGKQTIERVINETSTLPEGN